MNALFIVLGLCLLVIKFGLLFGVPYKFGAQAYHRGKADGKIINGWWSHWIWLAVGSAIWGSLQDSTTSYGRQSAWEPALGMRLAVLLLVGTICLLMWIVGRVLRPSKAKSPLRAKAELPPEMYVFQAELVTGPFHVEEVRTMWRAGLITTDAMYCASASDEWLALLPHMEPVPVG